MYTQYCGPREEVKSLIVKPYARLIMPIKQDPKIKGNPYLKPSTYMYILLY